MVARFILFISAGCQILFHRTLFSPGDLSNRYDIQKQFTATSKMLRLARFPKSDINQTRPTEFIRAGIRHF